MYRAIPEVNRICCQAARDRAYQQHINALKNMKSSVDTRKPQTPQTIGRNYKKYENDKIRCSNILRDNTRLENKMREIQKQEHFPRVVPQRPFTLQGQAQKDEIVRIDKENAKLLKAIETRKPTLNRTEWTRHRIDHTYQLNKMSEFRKTIPMHDVVREEFRMSMSRPATSMSHPKKTYQKHHSQSQNSNRPPHDYDEDYQNQPEDESTNEHDTSLSMKDHVTDTIHDDVEEQRNPDAKKEEETSLSMKDHVTDTVKEDVHEQQHPEEKKEEEKEGGLSMKDHVTDTIKDDVKEQQNPEEKKEEEKEGGLSLKGHVTNTIKEDVQEQKEGKSTDNSGSGGIGLKGKITGTISKN